MRFLLCFSCFNLQGIILRLTQGGGKGDREASPMWTQNGNVDPGGRSDEWGYNEWKGSSMCR